GTSGSRARHDGDMGIFALLRRDDEAEGGGALLRLVESFRDIGLDGRLAYSSARQAARRAQRGRGRRRPAVAVRRLVRRHRRGVTLAGFLTGLGGIFTLPVLLPTNVFEFYVQTTRMVGA